MTVKILGKWRGGTLAALWAFALAFSGCDRPSPKPPAPPPAADASSAPYARQKDPEYGAALATIDAERKQVGARRARLAGELQKLYAKAAADLPPGTPQEKVEAALLANPQKYPGWREFKTAFDKADAEFAAVQAKARNTVQEGVKREQAARKSKAPAQAQSPSAPAK